MHSKRIEYAMENYISENYFLPMNSYYELKETAESGKSLLRLSVDGENICVEEYDKKKRCNFLRDSGGLQKCIDHFLLKKNDENWDLYMIEMKSKVNDNKWIDVKQKVRASFLNIQALCVFLGINIGNVYTITTYERVEFNTPKTTPDPKALTPQLGLKARMSKKEEWEKGIIVVDFDQPITFPHQAVKMDRFDDIGLSNSLKI